MAAAPPCCRTQAEPAMQSTHVNWPHEPGNTIQVSAQGKDEGVEGHQVLKHCRFSQEVSSSQLVCFGEEFSSWNILVYSSKGSFWLRAGYHSLTGLTSFVNCLLQSGTCKLLTIPWKGMDREKSPWPRRTHQPSQAGQYMEGITQMHPVPRGSCPPPRLSRPLGPT